MEPPNSHESPSPQSEVSSVTVLVGFDVGVSHIFRVQRPRRAPLACAQRRSSYPWDRYVLDQWGRLFHHDALWGKADLAYNGYGFPIGPGIELKLEDPAFETGGNLSGDCEKRCRKIKKHLRKLKEAAGKKLAVSKDEIHAEAVFFPIGIGVLLLRSPLSNGVQYREVVHSLPGALKNERRALIRWLSRHFLRTLEEAKSRASKSDRQLRSITLLREVTRPQFNPEGEAYQLYNFGDEESYEDRIRVLEASLPRAPDRKDAEVTFHSSLVHVGWADAGALGLDEPGQHAVRRNFIVAMACWYALLVMDSLSTNYLVEAFGELADGGPRMPSQKRRETHTRRLAYLETASAMRPIRWSLSAPDLGLLQTIHRNWSSHQLVEQVAQRTELLDVHYAQMDADEREQQSWRVLTIGTLIALFTIPATFATVAQLLHTGHEEEMQAVGVWPGSALHGILDAHVFYLMVALVAIMIVLLLVATVQVGPLARLGDLFRGKRP